MREQEPRPQRIEDKDTPKTSPPFSERNGGQPHMHTPPQRTDESTLPINHHEAVISQIKLKPGISPDAVMDIRPGDALKRNVLRVRQQKNSRISNGSGT